MNVFGLHIDWTFVLLVLLPFGVVWACLGFEICHVTHRQRGIEVDRPVTDNLPIPPPPVVVPDHVPDGWEEVDA